MPRARWRFAALPLAASLALVGGCGENGSGGGPDQATVTVLAIYMVGSDLEDAFLSPDKRVPDEGSVIPAPRLSPFGAGSDDLRELVAGYAALSAEDQAHVALFVGFGGARKQSWQGIRYADGACLVRDAADHIFGNDTCYAFVDEAANLSAPATLRAFLEAVRTRFAGHRLVFLDLWDHGRSSLGFGRDTNQSGEAFLSLADLEAAFAGAAVHVDILGFDACLMANLEVGLALRPFADYLLASEETEPQHGWDYQALVQYLGQNRTAGPRDIAKHAIDNYAETGTWLTLSKKELETPTVETKSHATTRNKTLSVVELAQLEAVATALGDFVVAGQNDRQTLMRVFADAQAFGVSPAKKRSFGRDLRHWANLSRDAVATLAPAATALGEALDAAVLYARTDGTKDQAFGLSVFDFAASNAGLTELPAAARGVAAWKTFVDDFVELANTDVQAPVVVSEDPAGIVLRDDKGLVDLEVWFYERDGASSFYSEWGSLPATVLQVSADGLEVTVAPPSWDGRWIELCAGPCDGTNGARVPAYYAGEGAAGRRILMAAALLWDFVDADGEYDEEEGDEVTLFLEIDAQRNVVDFWTEDYTEDDEDDIAMPTPAKQQYLLEAGFTIQFYLLEWDESAADDEWVLADTVLSLNAPPTFALSPVAANDALFTSIEAWDIGDNSMSSAFLPVP